jgi:enoyl-CoA hydratase
VRLPAAGWRSHSEATFVSRENRRASTSRSCAGLSGCDIGVSWMLPRLIGASRAWELMLTGRIIDATEADRVGLVTRVVPDDQLLDSALETASLIVANSPWGVRMTKEVAWSQLEIGSLQAGIDLENRTQILSSFTGDHREAVAAFMEKRPANFT